MKYQFYFYLLSILLLISACEEDKHAVQQPLSSKFFDKEPLIETKINIEKSDVKTVSIPQLTSKKPEKEYLFTFKNMEGISSKIKVKNDFYTFSNIEQPIVMVNLFATWCPPCRGEIPHLSNLQKKFKKNLFILSALVQDDISNEKLKKFIMAEKIQFYISNNQKENLKFAQMITPKLKMDTTNFTLPLMVMFVNGHYFTHYEGSMPEEMIESDIRQLLQKIKG